MLPCEAYSLLRAHEPCTCTCSQMLAAPPAPGALATTKHVSLQPFPLCTQPQPVHAVLQLPKPERTCHAAVANALLPPRPMHAPNIMNLEVTLREVRHALSCASLSGLK